MEVLKFKQYKDLLPNNTSLFVTFLISYLDKNEDLKTDNISLTYDYDKILYKAIISYSHIGEEQKITLSSLGFNDPGFRANMSVPNEFRSQEIFREYYDLFTPYKNIDEYKLLTPEDIILHIKDYITDYSRSRINRLFNKNLSEFYRGMESISKDYKKEKLSSFSNSFSEYNSIEMVKYFEMVGRTYMYLKDKSSIIEKKKYNDNDIINLSFLIGYFLFDRSSNKNVTPEQKIVTEYFNSIGLTLDKIIEYIELGFSDEQLEKYNPTIALYSRLSDIIYDMHFTKTLSNVLDGVLRNKVLPSMAIQNMYFELNIPFDKDELLNYVTIKTDIDFGKKAEDIINYLVPDTKEVVLDLARLYNYLSSLYKEEKINKDIIASRNDLIDLCIIISSIKNNNNYAKYLADLNINIDSIEESLGVKIDFNHSDYTDNDITKFNNYVLKINDKAKIKPDITPSSIYENLYIYNINNSNVLNKLNTKNNSVDVIEYVKDKETNRKLELESSLLHGLDKDVYKLLDYISAYYESFNYQRVDINEDMKITLSIIYAIARYDSTINEYLYSKEITTDRINKLINRKDFRGMNLDMNIDVINDVFKSYIFDRDNKDISIYSILDNAVNKNTNFEFEKLLYNLNASKEDLTNIKEKIEPYKEIVKNNEIKRRITNTLLNCSNIRGIINYTLKIHKYIKGCVESSEFYSSMIKTEDDIEVLSVLFALYLEDDKYVPYFIRNKLSFEDVLDATGFTKEDLEKLKELSIDENLVLNYEKYIKKDFISTDSFARRVLDDDINNSDIIERINDKKGHSYNSLTLQTINKKLNNLTPDEGIRLLSNIVVPILNGCSITDISEYGNELNKHSSIINDELHKLIMSNSIEHSVEDINELCDGVIYTPDTKFSLKTLFRRKKEPVIVEGTEKSNIISSLNDKLDDNTYILTRELEGYEFIKNYIEAYLIKLTEFLKILEDYNQLLDEKIPTFNQDNIEEYTEYLNYMSMKKIVENKINTFKTSISIMKSELAKVHYSIVTHFNAISSLTTSRDAILPLIASELALNIGAKSESKALGISKDLFSLLQSVVNQNVIETKNNLDRLKDITEIDEEHLNYMNQSVNSYLEMLNNNDNLLTVEETVKPKTLEKKV